MTVKIKFGPMINYQMMNNLDEENVDSILKDVYEAAGFKSYDEFIAFYREHFDDECEWTYFNDYYDNESYNFETVIDGHQISMLYWDDIVWEAIQDQFDDWNEAIDTAYVNEMIKVIDEEFSEKIIEMKKFNIKFGEAVNFQIYCPENLKYIDDFLFTVNYLDYFKDDTDGEKFMKFYNEHFNDECKCIRFEDDWDPAVLKFAIKCGEYMFLMKFKDENKYNELKDDDKFWEKYLEAMVNEMNENYSEIICD